jgi:hypothetical protein
VDWLADQGYISDGEYECLYSEAIRVVRERYEDVSEPYMHDGQRWCRVRSTPCTDHTIFELCWNEDIADQIRRERRRE